MTDLTARNAIGVRIAERLADNVGQRRFSTAFNPNARLAFDDHSRTLEVAVPNPFMAEWIGRHFQDHLRQALSEVVGDDAQLQVSVRGADFKKTNQTPRALQNHPASDRISFADPALAGDEAQALEQHSSQSEGGKGDGSMGRLHPVAAAALAGRQRDRRRSLPRHSFNDFIVGDCNRLAFAAANKLVEDDSAQGSLMFLYGSCGLGKTHLLQATVRRLLEEKPNAKVLYTTGEAFTNDFIQSMRQNRLESFRRKIRDLDLLALDDVHFIADKAATQQEFLHSLDSIGLHGARIALASDCHPKLIQKFSDALVSRCMSGLVVQVNEPDEETRRSLIRRMAAKRNMEMLDSVVSALARGTKGSVREIEGTVTKLQALAELDAHTQRQTAQSPGSASDRAVPVGHALLNQLLHADRQSMPRRVVSVDAIIETVCEELQVPRQQMMGRSRQKQVVLARSLAIYLSRTMTTQSFPEIALAFGRKNHSTIITAAQRVQKQIDTGVEVTMPGTLEHLTMRDLLERMQQFIERPAA